MNLIELHAQLVFIKRMVCRLWMDGKKVTTYQQGPIGLTMQRGNVTENTAFYHVLEINIEGYGFSRCCTFDEMRIECNLC